MLENNVDRGYWSGFKDGREWGAKIVEAHQRDPMNNGLLVTLSRELRKAPLEELEAILNEPDPKNICVNMDGSVESGTETE